jgi:serine phosphatase RsbU (regulator of sigma subunit)
MALAAEIHHVIVPQIEMKLGEFEFYGRSVPSSEVGGDLIDVAGSEENWVAYLADVSGHGVAPGVVMGMVKSAARMLLSSGDDSRHLMGRLNEVLYPLKKPDMFATFCFVAKCGDGLRVGLAGHPAILKFSAKTGEITSLEGLNMPLGILPDGDCNFRNPVREWRNVRAVHGRIPGSFERGRRRVWNCEVRGRIASVWQRIFGCGLPVDSRKRCAAWGTV